MGDVEITAYLVTSSINIPQRPNTARPSTKCWSYQGVWDNNLDLCGVHSLIQKIKIEQIICRDVY